MKLVWGVLLLLLGFLGCVNGTEEGCARWVASSDGSVCCKECKQGNRLVSECGPNPKKLCEPCKDGTYISGTGLRTCRGCTQCTGVYKVKQACTSSSDTVCDCGTGYHCGDPKCSFCYRECGEGQQPANTTCQTCPPGTFNDKIHSKCVAWSTSCPQPEQKIVKHGTAVSDIICDFIPDNGKGHTEQMMVAILTLAPVFIIMFIVLSAYILIRWSKKKKDAMITREIMPERPMTEEVRHMAQQESICCFPQQEQGSSLESVASLDSKFKLLTV